MGDGSVLDNDFHRFAAPQNGFAAARVTLTGSGTSGRMRVCEFFLHSGNAVVIATLNSVESREVLPGAFCSGRHRKAMQ
jgi:hypothetical protein